jgi:hypothetical protein
MENEKMAPDETLKERRTYRERRVCQDRRDTSERRTDNRAGGLKPRRSVRAWLRSKLNARLGVDRRKGDRRRTADRRKAPRSILTKEEIHDLLSP